MSPHDDSPLTDEEHVLAEHGAALVAAAVADPRTRAPQALRETLERARATRPRAPRRWLPGLAGAVAAALVALVLVLGPGSGEDAPGVAQVAAVGRLPATSPAPAPAGGRPARLAAGVEGLAFPDWEAEFAWRATGARQDRVDGRAVRTVFYRNARGVTLGYAIVAGDALEDRPAGRDVLVRGTAYRVARAGGRTTVTWTQDGRTCIIDAPASVPAAKLVELAAWANV